MIRQLRRLAIGRCETCQANLGAGDCGECDAYRSGTEGWGEWD